VQIHGEHYQSSQIADNIILVSAMVSVRYNYWPV